MSREVHVRFCEGLGVQFPRATRLVIGFEDHHEAMACVEALRTRFAKFGLKLHEGKTRLIEFGRYAAERRSRRGEGRPETFSFLGLTHQCGRTRAHGWFTIHRVSMAKRIRTTLQAIKAALRQRRHGTLGETGRWLRHVVQGWLNYHAVPGNSRCLRRFVDEVTRHWLRQLRRRSQWGRRGWTWQRMQRPARRYLPRPRIIHPYPDQRFRARFRGKNRMR